MELTGLPIHGTERLGVQCERTEERRVLGLGVIVQGVAQSTSPFNLLLGSTRRHDDLVQLVVTFKDELPRERGRVALETSYMNQLAATEFLGKAPHTSSIVDLLHLDAGPCQTSLDSVDLVWFPGRGKTEPFSIQQADHVAALDAILGLPAGVKDATELNMTKRANSVGRGGVESLTKVSWSVKCLD